jgi:hypothetical protein
MKPGLKPTSENIQMVRSFFGKKWTAFSTNKDMIAGPYVDHAGCIYAAVFGALVFGGKIAGHPYHAWTVLPEGTTLDLTQNTMEVRQMADGVIPRRLKKWGADNFHKLPTHIYQEDPQFHQEVGPRIKYVVGIVDKWVQEFAQPKLDLKT